MAPGKTTQQIKKCFWWVETMRPRHGTIASFDTTPSLPRARPPFLAEPFHCRFRDKALGFRWKRYEEYLSPGDARVRAPVLDAALTGLLLVALHLRPAAHRTRVRNRFPLALACVHEEDAVWRRKERRWRRVPDVSRQVKARVRVQPAQRHRERARVLVFGHDCAGGTTRPTERSLAEDCVQPCSDFADLTREIAPGRHALRRYRPNGIASYKNALHTATHSFRPILNRNLSEIAPRPRIDVKFPRSDT